MTPRLLPITHRFFAMGKGIYSLIWAAPMALLSMNSDSSPMYLVCFMQVIRFVLVTRGLSLKQRACPSPSLNQLSMPALAREVILPILLWRLLPPLIWEIVLVCSKEVMHRLRLCRSRSRSPVVVDYGSL